MPNTELFELSQDERNYKIKNMPTEILLAELDDTVQFDMMKLSNEQWLVCKEKKVYQAIVRELRGRLYGK